MALPSQPPRYSTWSEMLKAIKQGETGWRPYALQHALRLTGSGLTVDGDFGPQTLTATKVYQRNRGLVADGIAGPATQAALIADASHFTHEQYPRVPDGLMKGYAEAEGVNILAATNWFTP